MASCDGYFPQHKPCLYGRNFCVECSLQALRSDPEAILEPLLAKLREHPLRSACASRIIFALFGKKITQR